MGLLLLSGMLRLELLSIEIALTLEWKVHMVEAHRCALRCCYDHLLVFTNLEDVI